MSAASSALRSPSCGTLLLLDTRTCPSTTGFLFTKATVWADLMNTAAPGTVKGPKCPFSFFPSGLQQTDPAVQVRSAMGLHRHVGAHPGQVGEVDNGGHAHPLPALRRDHAPRVHDHAVAVAASLVVVSAGLRRGHHVALGLYGPGPQQRLPVRHARVHGEGGGEGEDLRPGRRQRLALLREPEVVTHAEAEAAERRGHGGREAGAGPHVGALTQRHRARDVDIEQVGLVVGGHDVARAADHQVRVARFLRNILDYGVHSAQTQPHTVLYGQLSSCSC